MRDSQTEQTKHFGLINPISSKPIISNEKYYCSWNWGHEGAWEISSGFGWVFFWCCCLLACNPPSYKVHKTVLPVMAFKIDFVSISVPRKVTNTFAVSPLCHIWNICLALQAPTNLVLTLISACASDHTQPPFAPDDVCILFKQQTPPVLQDRPYLIKRSNDNLFPQKTWSSLIFGGTFQSLWCAICTM